jgi:hypothetical protein
MDQRRETAGKHHRRMAKLNSEKDVKAWVEARPEATRGQDAVALSSRAALRSLPHVLEKKNSGESLSLPLTSASLRCIATARLGTGAKSRAVAQAALSAHSAALSADLAAHSANHSPLSAANSAHSAALSAAISAFSTLSAADSALSAALSARSTADSAAHSADLAAHSAVWEAISKDATRIEEEGAVAAMKAPLPFLTWEGKDSLRQRWQEMKAFLLSRPEDNWQVWTDWYERIVAGQSSPREVEEAYVFLDDETLWEDPAKANAAIRERLQQIAARLPDQGPGSHFNTTETGLIDRASPEELDVDGNNIKRINQLRPLALQAGRELQARLAPNEHPELVATTDKYVAALAGERDVVDWGIVWGLGILLETRAKAASRAIQNRLLPELEDPPKAALDGLLRLHGPLVLSTKDGNDLFEEEKKYRLSASELDSMYKDIQPLVEKLSKADDVLTERAQQPFENFSNEPINEEKPERSAAYVASNTKNVIIVAVAGAVAASPTALAALIHGPKAAAATAAATFGLSLLLSDAIKKSQAFAAVQSLVTSKMDQIAQISVREWCAKQAVRFAPAKRFVLENRAELRTIAKHENLTWLDYYLDLLERYEKNGN